MKKREKIRRAARLFFIIYMILLVYFLLLSEEFGRIPGEEYHSNFKPFKEIVRFLQYRDIIGFFGVVINLLGNVVAFMPFGALIRWVLDRKVRWFQAAGYTFLFSLSVELLQLIARVGAFDVDDLLLNTLGGLLGFFVYYVLLLINRRRENHDKR